MVTREFQTGSRNNRANFTECGPFVTYTSGVYSYKYAHYILTKMSSTLICKITRMPCRSRAWADFGWLTESRIWNRPNITTLTQVSLDPHVPSRWLYFDTSTVLGTDDIRNQKSSVYLHLGLPLCENLGINQNAQLQIEHG